MKRHLLHLGFVLIAAVSLVLATGGDGSTAWMSTPAYAQGRGVVDREVSKWATTTEREAIERAARRGEHNIIPAMEKLGYEVEERYAEHEIYRHGIDAIYREVKKGRYNVIEAKAIRETGTLYHSILGVTKSGTQMEDSWIRKSLDDAYRAARRIIDDPLAERGQKLSAYRTVQMVDEITAARLGKYEKTLIVTRWNGVDAHLAANAHLAPNLLSEFDHVIELARNGTVLLVHK